ncbi:winged helix-turn-helix domain-containing protein [uncultured Oscillibacter sp.]|uniref:winged helix-turn-helix domain-containing protein n=1 Tax=uncultured Oscillibacter sp. TaxID=876091 RepID=UPI0025F3235B|nr:LysR family transcriptional regulator [uncultured Oscillibacter sp.]
MGRDFHWKVTVRLYDGDQRCFGPGVAALLARVEAHRSLRAAAASMEMAYSKAWRIVRTAEEALGCKLLASTIGGAHGGGAVLTAEASALLAAYRRCTADVEAYAQARLEQDFPLP